MIRTLIAVFLFIASCYTQASFLNDAKITRIHLNSNGFAYVKFDLSRSNICTGDKNFFVIDLSDRFGELQYSHALSAFHTQSRVKVTGTDLCISPHSIESIGDFQVFK